MWTDPVWCIQVLEDLPLIFGWDTWAFPDFIFPKGRGFKMASLNITSLLKRIDELRIVLDGQPIDILAINETRLDGSISDQDVKIVGYDVIRRDQ